VRERSRPPCRLHGLLAARAPVVCVLRRGPTDWFHVARWNLAADTIEHGAWLHATMYPQRCAVSADGALLAAFIRDERRDVNNPWHRYFAVSNVPWLTALAAWQTVNTYTTGAHFHADGTLVLAGTLLGPSPFYGSYPKPVMLEPVDVEWTRAALFRELHTGWSIERSAPWLEELPAPLAAHPAALAIARAAPYDAQQTLAAVSLIPGQREYYLVRSGAPVALLDVVWAEWHPQRAGTLVVATSTGHLQLLTTALGVVWEYDMNPLEPDPREAPAWAAHW
jgi:hypothetical protein